MYIVLLKICWFFFQSIYYQPVLWVALRFQNEFNPIMRAQSKRLQQGWRRFLTNGAGGGGNFVSSAHISAKSVGTYYYHYVLLTTMTRAQCVNCRIVKISWCPHTFPVAHKFLDFLIISVGLIIRKSTESNYFEGIWTYTNFMHSFPVALPFCLQNDL